MSSVSQAATSQSRSLNGKCQTRSSNLRLSFLWRLFLFTSTSGSAASAAPSTSLPFDFLLFLVACDVDASALISAYDDRTVDLNKRKS